MKYLLELETIYTADEIGFNIKQWTVGEHLGTHIDAPFHTANEGKTLEQIPAEDLIVPLVVIDIKDRAAADPCAAPHGVARGDHRRRVDSTSGRREPRAPRGASRAGTRSPPDTRSRRCAGSCRARAS